MKASEIMQAMIDAGAPIEAAMIALRALEDEREKAEAQAAEVERRRAVERDRKRRQRDKERDGDVDVTGQSRDMSGDVTLMSQDTPLSLSPNENNSNPHTHTPENTIPCARKADFPKPDWADAQVWADFLKNRKAKRLPNTATAHAKFLNDVSKLSAETGWPPGECLRACVGRGWGAIFDPRTSHDGRMGRNNGPAPHSREAGGLEKVGREVLDILSSRSGNSATARPTGPADTGGGDGRIAALPPPDSPRWDDGCGSPRMAAGRL